MSWKDRITVDPNVLVGKPIVQGTRIAVEFVIDLLARGWTVERILQEYDHLTLEDIPRVPSLCERGSQDRARAPVAGMTDAQIPPALT